MPWLARLLRQNLPRLVNRTEEGSWKEGQPGHATMFQDECRKIPPPSEMLITTRAGQKPRAAVAFKVNGAQVL